MKIIFTLPLLLALAATFVTENDLEAETDEPLRILFFGDSLTAGYGIEPEETYPALIQEKINQRGWNMQTVNAGLSGETSAGGLRRIDWILRRPIDVFVLELGANDGLRGIDTESTEENLQAILDRVREKNPQAALLIAGMQVPPNMGKDYSREFAEIFPRLAETNEAALIPFLLEDVGGIPELNLPDGIHPTAEGHKIMTETVWEILEPVLKRKMVGEKEGDVENR
ncbi:MAG TPA: arylesterase [Opitutales bacterium]|nr:arylesterase [Opitutales bacterium]